jgi:hypothetical protein
MKKTLYFIIPIAIISTLAWFGFNNQITENGTKLTTEKKVIEKYQRELKNEEIVEGEKLTINECEKQLLPTVVHKDILKNIFKQHQKNKNLENCKDIHLNNLKKDKFAKTFVKKKNTNNNIYNGTDFSNGLDIEYFDKKTKTITLFEEIEANENWDLSFLEKYEEKYNIEKYFLNSNLNLIENSLFFQFKDNKMEGYSDKEILEIFPIQNVIFKHKGKIFKYKLRSLSHYGSSFGILFNTTDTPPQYAKTFTMSGSFVYRKKEKGYKPRATIEIKNNGTASIQELDNENSILFFSTIKKKD